MNTFTSLDTLFGSSSFMGLDWSFWILMTVVCLIVIAMNIVFWNMKPLNRSEDTKH